MKRLLILLALLLASPVDANAQAITRPCHTSNGSNCILEFAASTSKKIDVAAAATTEIIAAVSGKTIYITSWDVMAAGTNNVKLIYGTGTNCGTGAADLTGAYPLIAQSIVSKGNGIGAILFPLLSNAVCITTSGTGQLSGSISYVQY